MNKIKRIAHCFQWIGIQALYFIIRFYQLFLSPVLGSNCRFYPSCSHYCQEALKEHGLIKGLFLSTKRICRCHPGCSGGIDPVPENIKSHHHG